MKSRKLCHTVGCLGAVSVVATGTEWTVGWIWEPLAAGTVKSLGAFSQRKGPGLKLQTI